MCSIRKRYWHQSVAERQVVVPMVIMGTQSFTFTLVSMIPFSSVDGHRHRSESRVEGQRHWPAQSHRRTCCVVERLFQGLLPCGLGHPCILCRWRAWEGNQLAKFIPSEPCISGGRLMTIGDVHGTCKRCVFALFIIPLPKPCDGCGVVGDNFTAQCLSIF